MLVDELRNTNEVVLMTTQDRIKLIKVALSKLQIDSIAKHDLEVLLQQEKEKLEKLKRRQYGYLGKRSR